MGKSVIKSKTTLYKHEHLLRKSKQRKPDMVQGGRTFLEDKKLLDHVLMNFFFINSFLDKGFKL